MDPNVMLTELRQLLADRADTKRLEQRGPICEEIADKFEELDSWISRGGFLPDAWAGR